MGAAPLSSTAPQTVRGFWASSAESTETGGSFRETPHPHPLHNEAPGQWPLAVLGQGILGMGKGMAYSLERLGWNGDGGGGKESTLHIPVSQLLLTIMLREWNLTLYWPRLAFLQVQQDSQEETSIK